MSCNGCLWSWVRTPYTGISESNMRKCAYNWQSCFHSDKTIIAGKCSFVYL